MAKPNPHDAARRKHHPVKVIAPPKIKTVKVPKR